MSRLALATCLAATLAVVGCSDSDGSATATINGAEFAADTAEAVYWNSDRGYDSGNRPERVRSSGDERLLDAAAPKLQLNITAGDDANNNGDYVQRQIALTVPDVTGPGTYDLVRGDADIQRFQVAVRDRGPEVPRYWTAPVGEQSVGTLTVESLTDELVTGRFDLTVPPAARLAGYPPAVVAGTFEAPVLKVGLPLDAEAFEASASQPLGRTRSDEPVDAASLDNDPAVEAPSVPEQPELREN